MQNITIDHDLPDGGFKEVFKHGCFGDNNIDLVFSVQEDEWSFDENNKPVRTIIKAKLLSVSITKTKTTT